MLEREGGGEGGTPMAQKRQEETYDSPERERDGESLYP